MTILVIEICDWCNTKAQVKGSNLCVDCEQLMDESITNE